MDIEQLKQEIDESISTNGHKEITGNALNQVLNDMTDTLESIPIVDVQPLQGLITEEKHDELSSKDCYMRLHGASSTQTTILKKVNIPRFGVYFMSFPQPKTDFEVVLAKVSFEKEGDWYRIVEENLHLPTTKTLKGSLYGGFVQPQDEPPYGQDEKYYYYADEPGTYENFGGFVIDNADILPIYRVTWSADEEVWIFNPICASKGDVEYLDNSKLDKVGMFYSLGFNDFDASQAYSQGDVVVYEEDLYRFKVNHLGIWDENAVDFVTVAELISK